MGELFRAIYGIIMMIVFLPGMYLWISFDGRRMRTLMFSVVCWWLIAAVIIATASTWMSFVYHFFVG